jgi:hypothetical protein
LNASSEASLIKYKISRLPWGAVNLEGEGSIMAKKMVGKAQGNVLDWPDMAPALRVIGNPLLSTTSDTLPYPVSLSLTLFDRWSRGREVWEVMV